MEEKCALKMVSAKRGIKAREFRLKIQFFPLVAGPFLKVSKIQKNRFYCSFMRPKPRETLGSYFRRRSGILDNGRRLTLSESGAGCFPG